MPSNVAKDNNAKRVKISVLIVIRYKYGVPYLEVLVFYVAPPPTTDRPFHSFVLPHPLSARSIIPPLSFVSLHSLILLLFYLSWSHGQRWAVSFEARDGESNELRGRSGGAW